MRVLGIHRKLLRQTLRLPDKLPREYANRFHAVEIPLGYEGRNGSIIATVIVKPGSEKGTRKSSKHRIFVVCPTCNREIPAGRWHQHNKVHQEKELDKAIQEIASLL
jgi:hypothetical protein